MESLVDCPNEEVNVRIRKERINKFVFIIKAVRLKTKTKLFFIINYCHPSKNTG